jgi:hypothetical protein
MATTTESTKSTEQRELTIDKLDHVSGGMKWDRNHTSPDVIDARGGQIIFSGWMITLDVKGNVSSVGPAP